MSVKITYFVHSTTYDNVNDRCTGWNPGELNELGIRQSKELTELIGDLKFDYIFTSDLKRAIDSAKLTWPNQNTIQDMRLRECNYGDYNGQSDDLVVYENHIEERFPNGECLKDVQIRIEDICKEFKEKYDGKHIVIVAHRAPQLALEVFTKGATWEEALLNDWRKRKAWQPGWIYIIE